MKTTILLFLAAPVVALWAALLLFTYLTVWAAGWARIKRHLLALTILTSALLLLPVAGLAKLFLPYRKILSASIFQGIDHRILMAAIPACLMWIAMVTLGYLLVCLPGWAESSQHAISLLILALSLLSWPAVIVVVMAASSGKQLLEFLDAHRYFAVIVPFVALGMAAIGLTDLLLQAFGWDKLKQNRAGIVMLAVVALSFPATGFVKVALPHKNKVLAKLHLVWAQSPDVNLVAGCSIFPANNIWNTSIRSLPVDASSAAYIETIGSTIPLHADFGSVDGIPYSVTDDTVPESVVTNVDPGVYRIPENARIEESGDRHLVVVNRSACLLYEMFLADKVGRNEWEADTGTIHNMRTNQFSATTIDAASLPIFPGLVRYQEVAAGRIPHALRFTAKLTRRAWVWPAQHQASRSTDPNRPPMGQRFRLRASFDISSFSPQTRVILTAMQEYGMFLADNGGNWFVTGAPDARWDPKIAKELARVSGSNFEAVDSTSLMVDPKSAEARQTATSPPSR